MPTIRSTYTKSSSKKNRSHTDCPATLKGPKNKYVATANNGPSKIREILTNTKFDSSAMTTGDTKPITEDFSFSKYTLRHIYSTDQIVRRSQPLNLTKQSKNKKILISTDLMDYADNSKSLLINENGKRYKINDFEVNKSLPPKSVIYSSCFNNKFVEGKSSDIKIDK